MRYANLYNFENVMMVYVEKKRVGNSGKSKNINIKCWTFSLVNELTANRQLR